MHIYHAKLNILLGNEVEKNRRTHVCEIQCVTTELKKHAFNTDCDSSPTSKNIPYSIMLSPYTAHQPIFFRKDDLLICCFLAAQTIGRQKEIFQRRRFLFSESQVNHQLNIENQTLIISQNIDSLSHDTEEGTESGPPLLSVPIQVQL